MPRNTRALTRAARRRASERDIPYQQARGDVLAIHEFAGENDLSFAEAEAICDDALNELLCEICGWTMGMVCPECPGCGRCSGWRHEEYMHDDDRADLYACEECGGDTSTGYGCECEE